MDALSGSGSRVGQSVVGRTSNTPQSATKPGSVSQIDGVFARLHSLLELANRLEMVTLNVVGQPPAQPQPPANSTAEPMPGHLSGKLECISDAIDTLRTRFASSIERLESYV